MTISPWLTFEKLKELDSSISALPNLEGVAVNTTIIPADASTGSVALGSAEATGTRTVAIGDLAFATESRGIAIGNQAFVEASFGVAIGEDAAVNTTSGSGIAIGSNSAADATNAVQIGQGTNSVATSLQFRSVPIANGTGLIIPGPFADDTAAAGGGVGIGNPYYTAAGDMKVRLT